MIDYGKTNQIKEEMSEELIQRVSTLEDDLMDVLINFMAGKKTIEETHRALLRRITYLEIYLAENINHKEMTQIKNKCKCSYYRTGDNEELKTKRKEYKERIE